MKKTIEKAQVSNPALTPLAPFIGEWDAVGKHAQLPGMELHASISYQWIEGGAFMIMHSVFEEEQIPPRMAIFGSDNVKQTLCMLFFDNRPVSRQCEVSVEGNTMRWWRNAPDISQRYIFTFSADNNRIESSGEISENGGPWQPDLQMVYTRRAQQ